MMKSNMLEYTQQEVSQLPDDRLEEKWKHFMAFSSQRQRLREDVQRMMRKKSPQQRVKSEDIPEGGMTTTKAGTREILLARVDGKIYAMDNACGHSGYPLHEGTLDGYVVICAWHDARFDVRSGAVLSPGRDFKPIKRFEVVDADDGTIKIGEEI
jgi:nitrite reductase/ring-hydroxylating ferredoxin subunit